MPRLAVLGQPVSHSRSPAMHNAALAAMGLGGQWTYEAIEVAPGELEALVRSLPGQGFAGVNATVPHKVAALAVADSASEAALTIGAANTLSFAEGRIRADNTDGSAIVDALPVSPEGKKALVLGAGGSARAAIWALREAGARVNVWNRTSAKADALAGEFGVGTDTARPDIIVNATTVGLERPGAGGEAPGRGFDTEAEGQSLSGSGTADLKPLSILTDGFKAEVVIDLVYGSRETELIAAARAAGASVVDGLEILARQGAASLRIWTNSDPPLDVMRRAARGEP